MENVIRSMEEDAQRRQREKEREFLREQDFLQRSLEAFVNADSLPLFQELFLEIKKRYLTRLEMVKIEASEEFDKQLALQRESYSRLFNLEIKNLRD
jgi:hypothetical protein